jgi:hypothetical protein
VFRVAYTSDGKRLACATGYLSRKDSGEVTFWDNLSGNQLFKLSGPANGVLGVAFSPDGRRIAAISTEKVARIWTAVSEAQALEEAYSMHTEALARPELSASERRRILLARCRTLVRLGRTSEAAADNLSAFGIPPRDPATPHRFIDLSLYYNAGTSGMAAVPGPGRFTFGGTEFDVRGGVVQVDARDEAAGGRGVVRVPNLRVAEKCRRLHFLHATPSVETKSQIGFYVVRYASGREEEVPIFLKNLVAVEDGMMTRSEPAGPTTAPSTGLQRSTREQCFMSQWDNPHPAEEITEVEFVADKQLSLIALTAEP